MSACSSCNAEVPAGARWCGICHVNLLNPGIGRLASPGKRLGAYFLDLLIPAIAFVVMLGAFGTGVATETEGGSAAGVLFAFVLFVAYVVWALKLFAHGTTPGKMMLGMRVVKENGDAAGFGTMLLREWIGKLISGMLLSIGYLWILFDRDRQGWHDKLASTFVVECQAEPRPKLGRPQ